MTQQRFETNWLFQQANKPIFLSTLFQQKSQYSVFIVLQWYIKAANNTTNNNYIDYLDF